jgi:hypothetical protein
VNAVLNSARLTNAMASAKESVACLEVAANAGFAPTLWRKHHS